MPEQARKINAMIDELVRYKKAHYPDNRRRILTFAIPDGKVRVEWLNAAALASIQNGRCACTY
jgi:hypothetical protein